MIQYLKLEDLETVATPRELVISKKIALEMWGKKNFVKCFIKADEDPNSISDKLVNGKIVYSSAKLSASKILKKEEKQKYKDLDRRLKRHKAIETKLAALDPSVADKKYNDLSAYERKLIFRIGGGPSDEELGI